MRIYDTEGNERDWAWLEATFGEGVRVDARPRPEEPGYVVTELRAKEGPCTIVVNVRDANNVAQGGIDVARWWDDPSLPALPANLATWKTKGAWGATNAGGDIGFGMGTGDGYDPQWPLEELPVSEVWPAGNAERVHGLGWLWGTNHLHLDVIFQLVEGGEEPPGPGDENVVAKAILKGAAMVARALDRIANAMAG